MIEQVVACWRRLGVRLNAGASPDSVAALEQRLGVALPLDVRLYFSLADGMPDGEVDQHLISFWSIEKILREGSGTIRPREAGLAVADVMIESWRICFQTAGGGVTVETHPPTFVLPSLTEFFEHYVNDPESLNLLKDEGRPTMR